MKKLIFFLLFFAMVGFAHAQNCIDFVIIHSEVDQSKRVDTIFCKILSQDQDVIVMDNGYAISTITRNLVAEVKPCAREMNAMELYLFKGIDYITKDYFKSTNSVGNYMRKAAFNAYLATGLGLVGGAGIVLGTTIFEDGRYKNAWIIGGSIGCAASLFFMTLSWNNIYKAGKLLDINKDTALYLTPGEHGMVGLSLRFK